MKSLLMMNLSSLLVMVSLHSLSFTNQHGLIYLGIWDCQSSQAVVEFVRRGIVAKQELSSICENLMDNCLARTSDTGGVGCDNMTVTIIGLLNGKSKDEWYAEVAERVANGDGPCAPPEFGMFFLC
jgi:protein phosphatase PTC2/3